MIEIRVEPAGVITRRRCLFCGEQTNKASVIAAVYEDGEFTGYVVCLDEPAGPGWQSARSFIAAVEATADTGDVVFPDEPARAGCISATPEILAERLRARAAEARADAEAFEALASDLPTLPMMAALNAVAEAYYAERAGGIPELASAEAVNDRDQPF